MKRAPRCRPRHALVPWRAAKAVRGWQAPPAQRGSGQTRVCTVSVQWPGQAIGEAPVLPRMVGGGAFPSLCPPFHLGRGRSGCGCPWGGGGVGAQDPSPSAHSPLCRALVQHSRPRGAPWEPPGSEMYQGGTRVKAAGILAGLLAVWLPSGVSGWQLCPMQTFPPATRPCSLAGASLQKETPVSYCLVTQCPCLCSKSRINV